jgi:hypothetical protein
VTVLSFIPILSSVTIAQPGAISGLDISLFSIGTITDLRHEGTFPTGVNGFGFTTTSCNPGTVTIPFNAAMNPNHPFICFLLAKEKNGRFTQISDWSYVKHAFASTNSTSTGCAPCTNPGTGSLLGIGCTDTYGSTLNGNHYYLGPPSEIDPWTGDWNPVCSHFDRGEPPVSPVSAQCDGVRSLSTTQASALDQTVGHRVRVLDAELNDPGSTFWYQGYYCAKNEPEANRNNNFGSKQFSSTWNGSLWSNTQVGTFLPGSVLQRWTGSTLSSNTNGTSDGRIYVAVKVTGPTAGVYHYEYCVHNRDNTRGVQAFRIPVCPSADVTNAGMHDVNLNAADDWSMTKTTNEIIFSTQTYAVNPDANALNWNSFFTFWFDSNAAPVGGQAVFADEYRPGAGSPSVFITSTAPMELYNIVLGPGCGSPAPTLYATGSPAKATLGNATFGLQAAGLQPNASVLVAMGSLDGTQALSPTCNLYMLGEPFVDIFFLTGSANAAGVYSLSAPIPNNPMLEGLHSNVQIAATKTGGAFLGAYDFTNGLRVRIGNSIPSCP